MDDVEIVASWLAASDCGQSPQWVLDRPQIPMFDNATMRRAKDIVAFATAAGYQRVGPDMIVVPRDVTLYEAAKELAEYASYAEIVGGISVNHQQIRKCCDVVFAVCRAMTAAIQKDADNG